MSQSEQSIDLGTDKPWNYIDKGLFKFVKLKMELISHLSLVLVLSRKYLWNHFVTQWSFFKMEGNLINHWSINWGEYEERFSWLFVAGLVATSYTRGCRLDNHFHKNKFSEIIQGKLNYFNSKYVHNFFRKQIIFAEMNEW